MQIQIQTTEDHAMAVITWTALANLVLPTNPAISVLTAKAMETLADAIEAYEASPR